MMGPGFLPKILRFDSVNSTNAKMREFATQGAEEGTVVVAKTQTAGRGSGKRGWHSPEGGLYFSTLLYPKNGKRVTDLAILAGAAVAQSVKELLPKQKEVTVKWPNDCLIGWKKVAGVLCESLGEQRFDLCVVGIGININIPDTELEPFKSNPFSATSFLVENAGGTFDVDKVLDMVLKKLFALYQLYQQQGFQPIQFIWQKNCRFVGKKVELRESGWREARASKANDPDRGMTVGTFVGIDESGAIVLSNQKGEHHHYYSGEITCFWP